MSSKFPKLIITAFSDEKFKSKVDSYSVWINPTNYSLKELVDFDNESPLGASGTDLKYKYHPPIELSFTIVIDTTGAVPNSPTDLMEEIDTLQKLILDFSGQTHEPNYVMINWGPLSFQGRASMMDTKYKLFSDDGKPLRAEVNFKFQSSISDEVRAAKEGKSSPDLTHKRIVKSGDTLPLMAKEIYGDPKYYIDVAEANGLDNFRNLIPGTRIYFPPISKSQT